MSSPSSPLPVRGWGAANTAVAACLVGAAAPLALTAWSQTLAIAAATVLFAVLLAGPRALEQRPVDADDANRRARAWLDGHPDPDEVLLLARGPEHVTEPERAWRGLARAGLLRPRGWYVLSDGASAPVCALPTVYGGALLGSGFGLVSVVAVVAIDALRDRSTTFAALAVVLFMAVFAGVEFVARRATAQAGARFARLGVDDPRTLAGRRALHLLASASAGVPPR